MNEEEQKTPLAKVKDTYLYFEDVGDIFPNGTTPKDSLAILKRYAENWIHETVLIQKAEDNLTEEQKNVDKQLQDYRNSLITYIYEKELVKEHLDTAISNEEIANYYEMHKNDFQLKDNIIKVIYVKVKNNDPNIREIKRLCKSEDIKDREQLATFCHQSAENSYLNDDSWLYFDDILKEVPIETYNKELFLRNNRFVEVRDSASVYFLNIKGFMIRESISPLSFEIENVKNIILNKRKFELIEKMKQDIYNETMNKNNAEIYINEKVEK